MRVRFLDLAAIDSTTAINLTVVTSISYRHVHVS